MYAVIRVRGSVKVRPEHMRTLELLRLDRDNHLVLVKEDVPTRKMLEKVASYVTYGEVSAGTIAGLLEKRGRQPGDKRLDAEFLKKHKLKDFAELAEAVAGGKKRVEDFGVKGVFRLNPPSKGFERVGIKYPYAEGGALGYRGKAIDKLVERMM